MIYNVSEGAYMLSSGSVAILLISRVPKGVPSFHAAPRVFFEWHKLTDGR